MAMHPLPHHYQVSAPGTAGGPVPVRTADAPELLTDAPPEFGGPEGSWSPETLLAAAVADCYILSFRAVARAAKLAWQSLDVDLRATLDRVDGVTRFTRFDLVATLALPDAAAEAQAREALAKAKRLCLVTNSLSAACELEARIQTAATSLEP